MGYYNSFVVRVWTDGNGKLHGRIEHVATRESLVFLDLDTIRDFIDARLAPPTPDDGDGATWPDDGISFLPEWPHQPKLFDGNSNE